ncbi:MAG: helix-turn-helix domain-containing protein [Hamadaea sp.]|nr:helix-turn-helix domain-containing protein [Hamadaea sp.]
MWTDGGAAIALAPDFWTTSQTIDALAKRDIPQFFRLVQRETGVTQTRLGVAVGLSQAQVSEVMSGSRRVSSVDVLARIAEGLAMPVAARSALFMGSRVPASGVAVADHDAGSEVTAVYAARGLVSRPSWNDVVLHANRHLWLYGMAELGYALDDDVPDLVERAAQRGCDIRVLLLDPEYSGAADVDAGEGSPPGTLATRTRAALARYQQMKDAAGPAMQIRVFSAPPTVSVVRGDDHMIVTPYLRFFVGGNSPTMELRRATGKMFDRYVKHVQRTWDDAKEWTP